MATVQNVLILSSWYPTKDQPFVGNFVERQAKLLSSKYSVIVVHVVPSAEKKAYSIEENTSKGFLELFVYYRDGIRVFNYLNQKKALKKVLRILPKIDLIHGHVSFPKGHLFILAKAKLKCPLVITEHGSYFRENALQKWTAIQKYLTLKTLSKADKIVAVSEILKTDLNSWVKNKEITVIGNHIDTNDFVPQAKQSEPFRFLHISTLDPIKNVKGIIDAFEIASSKNATIELTIVSDENAREHIEHAATKSCFQRIHFVGPIAWKETITYYQQSHCFVLNSEYETFSIVLAEAWSCGIPVLTTNVGIGFKLPSYLGFQVASNNSEDLAQKMLEMITTYPRFDPDKIREFALQFNGPNILLKLQKLYEEI